MQLLQKRKEEVDLGRLQATQLSTQIADIGKEAAEVEARIASRLELEDQRRIAHDRLADAKAENPRLKQEMDELKARIDQLTQAEGATCPICGGPLTPSDRADLIEKLTAEGKGLGSRYRTNKDLTELLEKESKISMSRSPGSCRQKQNCARGARQSPSDQQAGKVGRPAA
jgi:DNA repair exonuclease SbcCD ATPase subunit